jgi:hypothetical protein
MELPAELGMGMIPKEIAVRKILDARGRALVMRQGIYSQYS